MVSHRSIQEQVCEFMAERECADQLGLVAVSGGPDSVALARLLTSLHDEGQVGSLILAHLNHQLRHDESDADEAFVQDLAAKLNVEFESRRIDIKERAELSGENLEAIARQARYDWFAEVALRHHAAWVATGHTTDDHAETVLHRLLRGTGVHGLGGIPACRELVAGVKLIRPLLCITRVDVLAYLHELKQPYRVDSSNSDTGFTRNRIRQELLPYLAKEFNPAIVSVLCRLADQAAELEEFVRAEAGKLLAEAELPRAGDLLVFEREVLAGVPRHLLREMLRLVWARENWPAGDMGFDAWQRLASLVHNEENAVDLPGGIRAGRHGRVIQVGATL